MSPVPALEEALAVLRVRRTAVVLVDGRSGSGKTTLAAALASRADATLLRLEDVYPGWDGLEAASLAIVGRVLEPYRRGLPGSIRTWDWQRDRPGAARTVLPGRSLVVEGCGALTGASAPLADLRIWVELPEPERRRRALERDGDVFAPHWDRWARQERRIAARERPRTTADLVVDGRRFPQPLLSGGTGGGQ